MLIPLLKNETERKCFKPLCHKALQTFSKPRDLYLSVLRVCGHSAIILEYFFPKWEEVLPKMKKKVNKDKALRHTGLIGKSNLK